MISRGLEVFGRTAGLGGPAVFRLAIVGLLLFGGCGPRTPPATHMLFAFSGPTMGTTYSVKLVRAIEQPLSDADLERLQESIESELRAVNDAMSTYLEDSELSLFNQDPSTSAIVLSAATFKVLASAMAVGELTQGALDVTVAPLVDAWGFGPTMGGAPAAEAIRDLMERTGLRYLLLDAEASTVTKGRSDLHLDFSSLAKGFAVDQVVEALHALGEENFMVEVGGEVRVQGDNMEGGPWRIGLEQPVSLRGQVQKVVSLGGNEAVATSGDYRNYREVDGVRFSHLIDPRTGRPIEHRVASVSVIESTCMQADALSTALMVMGEKEGLALAEEEGIAALFLVRDGQTFVERPSSEFSKRYLASG